MRFRDNEGVTSPLGTALVIGISILLAGGVALMARVFTERADEETPPVTFTREETTDTVKVVSTKEGLKLSDFQIRIDAPGDFAIDTPIAAGTDDLAPNVYVLLGATEELTEGMTIHLCSEPAMSDVHVEVRYLPSNALLLSNDFRSLNDCPA